MRHRTCRNSEIYNHREQRTNELAGAPFQSTSDSELLGHWYRKEGEVTNEVLDSFDGIFACVLSDESTGDFVVARDAMGICPLYWGTGADGSMWFASEMKALVGVCENFDIFPPVRAPRSGSSLAAQLQLWRRMRLVCVMSQRRCCLHAVFIRWRH